MLRIGVDCRKINDGGIGVYLRNLLISWQKLRVPAKFILFHAKKDMEAVEFDSPFTELVLHDFPKYSISELFSFSRPLAKLRADLFFTPHYILPFNLPCPAVATIHDLIHLRYGTRYGIWGKPYAKALMRHACAKAKVILTDSRNSFRDITYYFPRWSDKVRVIYPAVDPDIYRELPKNDVLEFKKRMSLPDEFVLYTGALKPHKNPGALARLANELDIPIILATRDLEIYNNKLVPLIKDKHRISVVTITSDKQMALLYNAARLMIFPSFYEGFGLPPLEAMACGLPVICSGSSALPEVVGDAALLFSPRDYEDMVEKIKLCWRNLPLRDILKAKGKKRVLLFDWSKAAARIFEIFTGITTL